MRSARFVIGILAGVLLAAAVVGLSSFTTAPSSAAPTAQFVTAVPATTTMTSTVTSSSTTVLYPTAGIETSSASTSTTAQNVTFAASRVNSLGSTVSGFSSQPPSSVSRIVEQPTQSLLLLLPIIAALLLGLATYRGSAARV